MLPAVARALGVDAGLPPTGIELPEARDYVVFLVDGLGYELLRDHEDQAPFLHELLAERAGAGHRRGALDDRDQPDLAGHGADARHPRAWSATPPGSPAPTELLNALLVEQGRRPARVAAAPDRVRAGSARPACTTTVVNKREFAGSGLTVAGQRGAEFVGADKLGERMAAVLAASAHRPVGDLHVRRRPRLDRSPVRRRLHVRGELQLSMVDAAAEQLRETLPADVRILVVADHGMVDSPAERRIDVDEHPELLDGVALLGGEARFRHLYCRGGAVDDVVAAWRAVLGERAEVLTRDDALARGWFGAGHARRTPAARRRGGRLRGATSR